MCADTMLSIGDAVALAIGRYVLSREWRAAPPDAAIKPSIVLRRGRARRQGRPSPRLVGELELVAAVACGSEGGAFTTGDSRRSTAVLGGAARQIENGVAGDLSDEPPAVLGEHKIIKLAKTVRNTFLPCRDAVTATISGDRPETEPPMPPRR